jgi:hypothetical protein
MVILAPSLKGKDGTFFFGYEELGRLVLGGGRGHDEEEAWFGPAESKMEDDDADREPTAFYILCFSPRSDLSASGEGARSGDCC